MPKCRNFPSALPSSLLPFSYAIHFLLPIFRPLHGIGGEDEKKEENTVVKKRFLLLLRKSDKKSSTARAVKVFSPFRKEAPLCGVSAPHADFLFKKEGLSFALSLLGSGAKTTFGVSLN